MRGFKYQNISLSEAYDWQKVMADYLGEELGPVVGYKTGRAKHLVLGDFHIIRNVGKYRRFHIKATGFFIYLLSSNS